MLSRDGLMVSEWPRRDFAVWTPRCKKNGSVRTMLALANAVRSRTRSRTGGAIGRFDGHIYGHAKTHFQVPSEHYMHSVTVTCIATCKQCHDIVVTCSVMPLSDKRLRALSNSSASPEVRYRGMIRIDSLRGFATFGLLRPSGLDQELSVAAARSTSQHCIKCACHVGGARECAWRWWVQRDQPN